MFLKESILAIYQEVIQCKRLHNEFCALMQQPFISVELVQVISLVDCAHNERNKARGRV